MGLMRVFCAWPRISPEGLAAAAAGIHRTLSANPCDTLQEVRRKQPDLQKYFTLSAHPGDTLREIEQKTLSAHPGDTLREIEQKNKDIRQLLKKTPWPKVVFFSANGSTYSLPLRAESREPSARPAKARLAYLAGFFDGDGCVSCMLSGAFLMASQSYDQAEVLMLFRETFGGSITLAKRGVGLQKPSLQWKACVGDSAREAALLLAPHSITKQKQLLLAGQWPKTKSLRQDCKTELRKLKEYDSAVAGPCSWEYFAGFFDAEGYIKQNKGGASLELEIAQKHPQVLRCLRDFLSRSLGLHARLLTVNASAHRLRIFGLSDCKRILQHMLGAGMVCKAKQAEAALGLTGQNAAQVNARLASLTGNQKFGKRMHADGLERARKIKNAQAQARRAKTRGRPTEAEEKQLEIALLKREHDLLNARYWNQELIEYIRKLQRLHENSWEGKLTQDV